MKKVLAILMALAFALGCVSFAFAADPATGDTTAVSGKKKAKKSTKAKKAKKTKKPAGDAGMTKQ